MQVIRSSDPLLRVLFPDGVSEPAYKQSKLIGLMGKDTTFFGEGLKYVTVSIAPGAGGSSDFAEALANQGSTQEVRFTLTRRKLYEVGSIDGELFAAGRQSKGAVVDVVKHAMNRARYAYGRGQSRIVWGNGGGARGKITSGSTISSGTVSLTSESDGTGFFKGMWVQLAADDGTGGAGVRDNGRKVQIGSIKRSTAGVCSLTLASGNWNQISGATAATDYIFRAGDYNVVPHGKPAWNPVAEPGGSDSFLTVNRGTAGDVNYLSGWRTIGNGQPKQQTIIDAMAQARMAGIPGDLTCFLNPLDLRDAFKDLSQLKSIPVSTDMPKVGYKGIEIVGANGSATGLDEPDVPKGYFWLCDPKTMTQRSAGDVPMILDFDGLKTFMRNPTGDNYQFRLGGYYNNEDSEPGFSVIGTFGAS